MIGFKSIVARFRAWVEEGHRQAEYEAGQELLQAAMMELHRMEDLKRKEAV